MEKIKIEERCNHICIYLTKKRKGETEKKREKTVEKKRERLRTLEMEGMKEDNVYGFFLEFLSIDPLCLDSVFQAVFSSISTIFLPSFSLSFPFPIHGFFSLAQLWFCPKSPFNLVSFNPPTLTTATTSAPPPLPAPSPWATVALVKTPTRLPPA